MSESTGSSAGVAPTEADQLVKAEVSADIATADAHSLSVPSATASYLVAETAANDAVPAADCPWRR